jgi:hypothetical protein
MQRHGEKILALLPCVLLIVVAVINFMLVKRNDLSIWYGGSFGMFASLDGPATRYLTITYSRGEEIINVDLDDYETEVARIKTNPSNERIQNFLQKLCQTYEPKAKQLSSTLYKLNYDPIVQKAAPVIWKELTIDCLRHKT